MVKYKTKIDWWFWYISILLLGFGVGMLAYKSMRTTGVIWITIVGVVLILCILDTRYIFEDEALIVKFSLFEKYIIPYKYIMNITKIHNFDKYRGIGLSADRIKIEWNEDGEKNYVFISPADRDGFIKEINSYSKDGER